MRPVTIHDLPEWRVTSYGNGLAYAIEYKPSGADVFFQDDAAAGFREEFDNLTMGTPSLSFADALHVIFSEHEAMQC